jgi:hypothetical protein
MEDPETPFSGLFNLRRPGVGRDRNWTFGVVDLHDSVRRMQSHLDQLLVVAAEPGWVFLTTVENDAQAGRFPEVLRNFFAGEFWSTHARYFVGSMGHTTTGPARVVGRLTFETRPGQLAALVGYNEGFSWGVDLSVGGVQVRERDVEEALSLNSFAATEAPRHDPLTRLAWATSKDLDRLGLTVSVGFEGLLQTVDRIGTV